MKFNVTVAQDSPSSARTIVFSVEDSLAKRLMSETPNAVFGSRTLLEVNPVPSSPGKYYAFLESSMGFGLIKGTRVSVQTLHDDCEILDGDPDHTLTLSQTIEYTLRTAGGGIIFAREVISNYNLSQDNQFTHPMNRSVESVLSQSSTLNRSLIRLLTVNSILTQTQDLNSSDIKNLAVESVLTQSQIVFGILGGTQQVQSNLNITQNIIGNRVHAENVTSTYSLGQTPGYNYTHLESLTSTLNQVQTCNKIFNEQISSSLALVSKNKSPQVWLLCLVCNIV
jgi:hypothetical protein